MTNEPPGFTLRATDICAPLIVDFWVAMARDAGVSSDKIRRAEDIGRSIRKWQRENPDKVKVPD